MKNARYQLNKIRDDYSHGQRFGRKTEQNLLVLLDTMLIAMEDMSREVEELKAREARATGT